MTDLWLSSTNFFSSNNEDNQLTALNSNFVVCSLYHEKIKPAIKASDQHLTRVIREHSKVAILEQPIMFDSPINPPLIGTRFSSNLSPFASNNSAITKKIRPHGRLVFYFGKRKSWIRKKKQQTQGFINPILH